MLEAIDLTFAYPGESPLLNGISLAVSPGDRVHVKAPSGVGKTTLCKLLAGYERPLSGKILLDGKPLPRRGRCPVQMIGQHPEAPLDPRMRMRDSLLEAGSIDDALLERLGIRAEWMSRFPHELSGGEMQRFCIARALMAHPSYLIADEISTMLDAVTQAQIWEAVIEEVGKRSLGLVFTTHSRALAELLAPTLVCDITFCR